MAQAVETNIDTASREFFFKSIAKTKYAGIRAVQICYRAMCLDGYRREFINGKRGHRDGRRAAIFMEVIQLKNAEARLLSFFVALSSMGHKGTICPEDVLAAQVVEATGGKMAPRTFRRALASLCDRGWLIKRPMATGTRAMTPKGWKTLQVNKIIIPFQTRLICANSPLSYKSPPRPKRPTVGEDKAVPPSGEQASNKQKINSEPKVNSVASVEPESNELPPKALPSVVGSIASVCEPKTRKEAKNRKNDFFGRRSRLKSRKTWNESREIFIRDVLTHSQDDEIARVVRLQTDSAYPPLCPTALRYETYIFGWTEFDWKERRRIVRHEILPELSAFVSSLRPPNPAELLPCASHERQEKARERKHQWIRVSRIMKALPEQLLASGPPDWIRTKISSFAWELAYLPMYLNTGKILMENISDGDRQQFREIADMVGSDD